VHRQGAAVQNKVKSRLTPELKGQLAARAAVYAATVAPAFQAFTGDARTRKQIATADAALRELESKGR
jgi:hypothetical protein